MKYLLGLEWPALMALAREPDSEDEPAISEMWASFDRMIRNCQPNHHVPRGDFCPHGGSGQSQQQSGVHPVAAVDRDSVHRRSQSVMEASVDVFRPSAASRKREQSAGSIQSGPETSMERILRGDQKTREEEEELEETSDEAKSISLAVGITI